MTTPATIRSLEEDVGVLVAEHRAARGLQDFTAWADNPVGFIRTVLKVEPWSRQEEVARAVRDHRLVAVRSHNSCGKDWIAAALALWFVYCRRGFVLITGPTERQVRHVVMAEVRRHFGRARELPGQLFELALQVDRQEQQGILAFTASEASRATGLHAPRLLAIITEAQAVEPFAFEAMHANLSSEGSRLLVLGNPLFNTGRFFEASRNPHWHAIRIPASEHPNIIAGREVIPGAITEHQIQTIVSEYGRDSQVYRSRVLAEFPLDAQESLIRRSWVDDAVERWQSQEYRTSIPVHAEAVAALDPARFGSDKSALAIRRGPVLERIEVWGGLDTMATCGRALEVLRAHGVPLLSRDDGDAFRASLAESGQPWRLTRRLWVDEIGIGSGIVDRLAEQGRAVKAFNSSKTPEWPAEAARMANDRARIYWNLRTLLEQGRIALPPDASLLEELCATRWRVSSAGKILIEPKAELRDRLGRSPDRADAVAMAFADFGRAVGWSSVRVRWA